MDIAKDVYETEDLPEAEQDYDEDTKDCVETLNISALTAFSRFKGKEVLLNEQDKKGKWKGNDNPMDRAKRIIQELDSLKDSLKTNSDFVTVDPNESVSKEQLLTLTEALSTQVRELDLEKYFGSQSGFEIKDPKNAVYKLLVKKIDNFAVQSPAKTTKNDTKNSYSLIRQTTVNECLNKQKMANLSKRLDVLEKVMGDNSVKLSGIVSDCASKGLLEAVEKLTSKTSLLNTNQLAIVESRLNGVVNKLQTLSTVSASEAPLDPESRQKVSELYELVKKSDPTMDTVTNIVDQCVSMQDFHAKNAKLSQCLSHLEVMQHEVHSKQEISQLVLKNIAEKMPINFLTMETNVKLMDERITKMHR